MDTSDTPDGDAVDAELIADQFDVLVSANRWLEDELRRIDASRAPVGQVTVNRLVALEERMRPVALVRNPLANIDPSRLLAGVRVWVKRQTPVEDTEAAADRALRVWSGDRA